MSNRPLRPHTNTPLLNPMGVVRLPVSIFNQSQSNSMTFGTAAGSMNALLRYSIQRAPVSYQTQPDIRPVQFTSINNPVTVPQRFPILSTANIRPAPTGGIQTQRPLPPMNTTRPIQPAKQPVQRKTLAFSQVELFQSDVYTEKKTRALLPAVEKAPLRPIAEFLEDLGRSLVKRKFPDILTYKPPPIKKKRNTNNASDTDEEYVPESDFSSSSSDDEEQDEVVVDDDDTTSASVMFEEKHSDDLLAEKFYLDQLFTFDTSHKCQLCGFEGSSRFDLSMHYHHGRVAPYGSKLQISCCLCDYIAADSSLFSQHVLSKHQILSTYSHSGKSYACHYCNSEQATEHNMHIHLEKCAQKFKVDENLKPTGNDSNYLFRGHSNSTSFLLGSLSNKPDNNSTTPDSNAKQRDRGTVSELETITGVCEIIICELCNGLLSNIDSLFQHFVLAHNAHISDTTKRLRIKPFECVDCLKEFWTPMGLFYHRQMKKDRCPVGRLCPYCQKVSSVALIYKHIESQHNEDYKYLLEKSETCLICLNYKSEALFDRSSLGEHLAKFHEQKLSLDNLKCPMCAFIAPASNSATHLRDHMIASGHHFVCKQTPRCASLKITTLAEFERHRAFTHAIHYYCESCSRGGKSQRKFTDYNEYERHVREEHIRPCSVIITRCEVPPEIQAQADTGNTGDDDVVIL